MAHPDSEKPTHTRSDLLRDIEALGIEPGTNLIVHSSLSSIGWVEGGPAAVVRALFDAIGDEGTLAMPAATPQCSDPDAERFDIATTPTTMGAIAEIFRTWPETLRSDHPLESVCASGPRAEEITREQPLAFSEGPGSPFARLHELDSWILLLGVDFNRCTALHFAESLVEKRRTMTVRIPTMEDGEKIWIEVPNVADDNDRLFPIIGDEFRATDRMKTGLVGEARSSLFSMRDLVGFAVEFFERVL